jgi:lipid-A-disaccharide synthase
MKQYKESEKTLRIMIVAGEPSGDIHGALLMQEIKNIYPNIFFYGIGGSKMEAEGLSSIVALSDISVIGFSEVLKRAKLFLDLLKKIKTILIQENIDCFIPIDYPGFNIKVSKFAYKQNIPVFYYIAPQLWAWGKKRYKKLEGIVNQLFVVFPFEKEFFNQHNISAEFVGHPLLDNPDFLSPVQKFEDRENTIAFFPGSRRQELQKNLQFFAETANLLNAKLPDFNFCFAVSNNLNEKDFSELKKHNFNYTLSSNSWELMRKAKAGIVKTGTTTLEAALLGMNMVMAYRTSASHYFLGKHLINLNYIALPNILLNKEVVPECIQKEATPEIISNKLYQLISNPKEREQQQTYFEEIRNLLGKSGASKKTAELILSSITQV